jgi:Ca2+/Na+ antiporter
MTPVELVLGSVTFLVGLWILAFLIIGTVAFWKTDKGTAKSFGMMFQRADFLRILTVMFVVLAVIWLSAMDALKPGAIAVLSGVAGYVLGGLGKSQQRRTTPKPPRRSQTKNETLSD